MKQFQEKVIVKLLFCSALVSLTGTILIFGFMAVMAFPLFRQESLLRIFLEPWNPVHGQYGIYPMMAGSLTIALLAVIFAFPLSFGCASLLTFAEPSPLIRAFRRIIQLMTGVPTVIYGFVGIFFLVPFVREAFQYGSGMCVLTAAIGLSLLVSPTMILLFTDGFRRVPLSYLMAAESLGANQVEIFFSVILPQSRRELATGFILGFGRAIGDTLIALMLAGNAITVPGSVLDPARSLTSHIALVFESDQGSPAFKSVFVCGILLYIITTVTAVSVRGFGGIGKRTTA